MLVVLNVGNTNTQYSFYDERSGTFSDIKTVPTKDIDPSIIPENTPAAAATVVPGIKDVFHGKNIMWLAPDLCKGLDLTLIDRRTIGADRLANAMSLLYFSEKLPAICVDCGTAVTFEVVDSKNVFIGGAIAPGRMLMRKALNSFTAQLPLIEIRNTPPERPSLNTSDAISMGVDRGIIGSVKEILAVLKKSLGTEACTVVAVGGDALFFTKHIPDIYLGGIDYTLRGIAKAWELNNI